MIETGGKILRIFTNSIRMKIILCFVIIILVLESVSVYSYLSGKKLNGLYNNTLEKHLLFNDIFVNLGSTNEYLQKYLQDDSKAALSNYEKECKALTKASSNFEYIVNDNGYTRETTDLKYMLQSYIAEGNRAIALKQSHKIDASNSHYYSAVNIYGLINKSFKEVYTIILQDTNRVKVKVIDNRNKLYALNGILLLLVGILGLLFARWVAISLTKPIRLLTSYAARFTKGETSMPMIEITTHDEVAILSKAINQMLMQISKQIEEIKEKAELEAKLKDEEMEILKVKNLLKESELKALQARINPHFLFNTLNMITQSAYLEEASQTTSLLEVLAGLLRYNLDTFNKAVTIEAEIINMRDYVFIQQKRFGERIMFVFDVDEGSLSSKIPCLSIQPLVENSIMHGVGVYMEGGIVGVEVKRQGEGERIKLRIYDNGTGIDEERLIELRALIHTNSPEENSKGIGLLNVYTRLRLFYNSDIKMEIISGEGKNTEIVFDLPYMV